MIYFIALCALALGPTSNAVWKETSELNSLQGKGPKDVDGPDVKGNFTGNVDDQMAQDCGAVCITPTVDCFETCGDVCEDGSEEDCYSCADKNGCMECFSCMETNSDNDDDVADTYAANYNTGANSFDNYNTVGDSKHEHHGSKHNHHGYDAADRHQFKDSFDNYNTVGDAATYNTGDDSFDSYTMDTMGGDSETYNTDDSGSTDAPDCIDMAGWVSKTKHSCADYASKEWCKDGTYGSGWNPKYGTFADWGVDGVDASTACCACKPADI